MIVNKIAAVEQLLHWAKQIPGDLEPEGKQGWMSARSRVVDIANRSDSPDEAADLINQIIEITPSPQNERDRGRLRAFNESLDSLSKEGTPQDQTLEAPPEGSNGNNVQDLGSGDQTGGDQYSPGKGRSQIPNDGGMGTQKINKRASVEEDLSSETYAITEEEVEFGNKPVSNFNKLVVYEDEVVFWKPMSGKEFHEDGDPYHYFVMNYFENLGYSEDYLIPGFYSDGYVELLFDEELEGISDSKIRDVARAFREFDPSKVELSIAEGSPVTLEDATQPEVKKAFSDNPQPYSELPGRYNPETMEREPWIFDGPLGGHNKFLLDDQGHAYFWQVGEDLQPTHMKAVKMLQQNLGANLIGAGEIDEKDVRGIEGSAGIPVFHFLNGDNSLDLVREAMPLQKEIIIYDEIEDLYPVTAEMGMPVFNRRGLFDLVKYVKIKGASVDWNEFKESSNVPYEDLSDLLEILTETGAMTSTDNQPLGGLFKADESKLEGALKSSSEDQSKSGTLKQSSDLGLDNFSDMPIHGQQKFVITLNPLKGYFWPSDFVTPEGVKIHHSFVLEQLGFEATELGYEVNDNDLWTGYILENNEVEIYSDKDEPDDRDMEIIGNYFRSYPVVFWNDGFLNNEAR